MDNIPRIEDIISTKQEIDSLQYRDKGGFKVVFKGCIARKEEGGSTGSDLHISITGCRRTLSSCKWGYVRPKIMSSAKNREIVVLKNN